MGKKSKSKKDKKPGKETLRKLNQVYKAKDWFKCTMMKDELNSISTELESRGDPVLPTAYNQIANSHYYIWQERPKGDETDDEDDYVKENSGDEESENKEIKQEIKNSTATSAVAATEGPTIDLDPVVNIEAAVEYYSKAIQSVDSCIQKRGRTIDITAARKLRRECLHHLGFCQFYSKRYKESQDTFREYCASIVRTEKANFVCKEIQKINEHMGNANQRHFQVELWSEYIHIASLAGDPYFEISAYLSMGQSLQSINRNHEAVEKFRKGLQIIDDIAKAGPIHPNAETPHKILSSNLLSSLGRHFALMGDEKQALHYVKLCRKIQFSEREIREKDAELYALTSLVYAYLAMEKHDQEAIDIAKRALLISESMRKQESEIEMYHVLAEAYIKAKQWDDAIASLETVLLRAEEYDGLKEMYGTYRSAYKVLGQVHLEKFCVDKTLIETPDDRNEVLQKALSYQLKAREYADPNKTRDSDSDLVDLAQEYYLLGEKNKAYDYLCQHLDRLYIVGIHSCQHCRQVCQDDMMQICRGCKVSAFCSPAHQKKAWKKGRLSHKYMCPVLNRWRVLNKKGRVRSDADEAVALFEEFFASAFRDVSPLTNVGQKDGEGSNED